MNALVVRRANRLHSAVMVVLFGRQRIDEDCRWKAQSVRNSARQEARSPGDVTCYCLVGGGDAGSSACCRRVSSTRWGASRGQHHRAAQLGNVRDPAATPAGWRPASRVSR